MSLASLSIRRPTFIAALVAVMLVVGVVCWRALPVDQFPDITFPVISVTVPYRGAGPEELETLVAKPLEEELASISGLRHVSSINQDNMAIVLAEFSLGADIKYAEQQVRDRLALARPKFPKEVDEPMVRRFDVSDQPILILALTGNLAPSALYDLADQEIKPRLEQVPNVGQVKILGGTRRQILVSLDRDRLRDARLSVTGVAGRIAANSQNVPVGRVAGAEKDKMLEVGLAAVAEVVGL
ncbi:MAG: efflux RND transporter permease subunit [bacterium]